MESMAHRVLLVEDDERIHASMRLSLEDEGYEVEEAGTGEEASSSRLKRSSRIRSICSSSTSCCLAWTASSAAVSCEKQAPYR